MADKAELLKKVPLFSVLGQPELRDLAGLAVARSVKAGEFIFWEGDAPTWFYILLRGEVKVVKHSSLGKEFIVAFFGPGEMVGEVAIFEGKPFPASAQAVTDAELLAIKRDDLLGLLARQPELAFRIIGVLGGRLREAQNRLRDLAGERVEQRIARILLMMKAKLGDTLPFTRQELAEMSGTTTETAIRVMSRLREGGIIRSDRGRTVILDEVKLRLLSEGPPAV